MEEILIPIVALLLPVAIVFIIAWRNRHEVNKKTEVLLAAIEKGQQIDPELFAEKKGRGYVPKTLKERLAMKAQTALVCLFLGIAFILLAVFADVPSDNAFMIAGGVLCAVGIAYSLSYFLGKRMFEEELSKNEQ